MASSRCLWTQTDPYGRWRDAKANQSRLMDNEYTLLTETDLVFIDPVGTGYNRSGEDGKDEDFFNVEGDAESLTQFIQQYITKIWWVSPNSWLVKVMGRLALRWWPVLDQRRRFKWSSTVSLAVNFQTFIEGLGNDLPYMLFLPTFTTVAWHQGKMDYFINRRDALLQEVREWSLNEYAMALLKAPESLGGKATCSGTIVDIHWTRCRKYQELSICRCQHAVSRLS